MNNLDQETDVILALAGAFVTAAAATKQLTNSESAVFGLILVGGAIAKAGIIRDATNLKNAINKMNVGSKGVAITAYKASGQAWVTVSVMNRDTGEQIHVRFSLISAAALLSKEYYIGTPYGNWQDSGQVFARDFD
jgi:hypothetical protein